MLETPSASDLLSTVSARNLSPVRVALLCDFLEEQWPSMDLSGNMLFQFLRKNHAREIASVQLRPTFRPRLMRIPGLPKAPARNADRLANRFLDYPCWLRRQAGHFDLFHLIDHSYAQLLHTVPCERAVVTCHDLDTFRCLLEPQLEKRPYWFQAMARRIMDGFHRAAHVICVSEATRDQLLHYRLFPPERISVIHAGVNASFTSLPDPAADSEVRRLLGPRAANEVRLLSVGSTIPRKRIDILLRVFATVRKHLPEARLIRVGGSFTEAQLRLVRELGVEGFVSVLPFVSSEVLASIYRDATLLLQPSESEGFGLPLAEAMACGCPVLASDLAVLREVGGSVCAYCPVGDVDAWECAILRILQDNAGPGGTFEAWRQQARVQASRYSWSENALATVQVYQQVLQRASHSQLTRYNSNNKWRPVK